MRHGIYVIALMLPTVIMFTWAVAVFGDDNISPNMSAVFAVAIGVSLMFEEWARHKYRKNRKR